MEDRIAAVYDHALVQRTAASGHLMAYFAWEGVLPAGDAWRRELLNQVNAMADIDKGSVRVSVPFLR